MSDHDHDHYYNDDHGDCCDDQMSACEQLTCEQSPMAVDGPLFSGAGGIVLPTPTHDHDDYFPTLST